LAKTNSSNLTTMEELLASLSKPLILTRGQAVTGEVVAISDQEVTLDLSTKSEGVIPRRDFPTGKEVKVGDKIEAFVIEPENDSHQVVLSTQSIQKSQRPTRSQSQSGSNQQDFSKVAEKYIQDEIYTGTVTKVSQFGVFVALEEGIEGLIHSSKVTAKYEPGQKVQVTVDSIEPERRRIALSPVVTSTKDLIYK